MKIKIPKLETVYTDTETTGLLPFCEDMPYAVGMLFGDIDSGDIKTAYWEWQVDPFTRKCVPCKNDLLEIKEIISNPDIVKVFHNAKFDMHMLEKISIPTIGRVEDTMFAARICNTLEFSYGLKDLTIRYFDIPIDDQKFVARYAAQMRIKARKLGWNVTNEDISQDYWLCQYVDQLLPEVSDNVQESIKNSIQRYCLHDCMRTALLWKKYSSELSDEYYKNKYEEEIRLLPIVMDIERRGCALSPARLKSEIENAQNTVDSCMKDLISMANNKGYKDMNFNSSKQLIRILYEPEPVGFGLEIFERTTLGRPSTSWTALRPHYNHPFVAKLIELRAAEKSINTFFSKYDEMKRPDPFADFFNDSEENNIYVIHPSLNQCGTKTGRFSCDNPNLQQVANSATSPRGTHPIQARAPFGPRPGYRWYMFDFVQMELRVFADCARVQSMLDAIYAGRDLNTENANRAWGGKGNQYALEAAAYALELGHSEPTSIEIRNAWDLIGWNSSKSKKGVKSDIALQSAEDWLSRYDYDIVAAEKTIGKSGTRSRSKIVTFAKIYGGGPNAVVDLLYCSEDEAKEYWKQYDRAFPEINDYIRSLSRQAEKDGYIITRYGRKLRVERDTSYKSVNYMIQGTCADMMKYAIVRTNDLIKSSGIDAGIVLTIHDELIFEIRADHSYKWLLREISKIMSDTEGRLSVPTPVECKRANTRWDVKEIVEL